eukprot:776136-Pyramimonas_sp.AAC.1
MHSAAHRSSEITYRGYPTGDAQLRTGVRNKSRGTLKTNGMLGERGGRIVRTATVSKGAQGCGVDWDGMDT